MFDDPARLVELLVMALFGVGGYKGVNYGVQKYMNGSRPVTSGAGDGVTSTGSVQVPVDCVTQGECERAQKAVNDSIHDLKADIARQTQSMDAVGDKLGEKIDELNKTVAGGEAVAIKAANHSVTEHETRFKHGGRG